MELDSTTYYWDTHFKLLLDNQFWLLGRNLNFFEI